MDVDKNLENHTWIKQMQVAAVGEATELDSNPSEGADAKGR